jgi:hypothetical protein
MELRHLVSGSGVAPALGLGGVNGEKFTFHRGNGGKFIVWVEGGNLLFVFGLLSRETMLILYLEMI